MRRRRALGEGAHRRALLHPPRSPCILSAVIPFLHLGRFTVPTFGLMVATAMVCAYFVLRMDILRRGLAIDKQSSAAMAEAFIALPCLAGILGAKLYHELQSPREFLADPLRHIFTQYGFAWFGGLLAGFAAYAWLAWMRKIPLLEMMDAGSAAAAVGYGIGRIGCLLSGDGDYGSPTSLPWGMSFPNGLVPTTQRVHPTPIYELIVACAIAWWLWRLGAKQIVQRSLYPSSGMVFAAYLILTGAARFLVEFIRINPRSFLGMSNAQAASLFSMIAGVALLWRISKRSASPLVAGDKTSRPSKR
jgi:phosphatidylglycerol:prolipoprotein diacylglycerol transferase